jgi:hypothetical protein
MLSLTASGTSPNVCFWSDFRSSRTRSVAAEVRLRCKTQLEAIAKTSPYLFLIRSWNLPALLLNLEPLNQS